MIKMGIVAFMTAIYKILHYYSETEILFSAEVYVYECGDEFAVMIDGGDYENRNELIEKLIKASVEREEEIGSTLAVGMSEYIKGEDESVLKVFSRADERMYMNKTEMKSGKPAR